MLDRHYDFKIDTNIANIPNVYTTRTIIAVWPAKYLSAITERSNKLFKYVNEIKGNADFCNSKITSLGQLQSIGGFAKFSDSKITDLGQLQSIGGKADFSYSKIADLGQLKSIGGDADFRDSKISIDDINKLEIGGEIKR